jgi:hypothetical protein
MDYENELKNKLLQNIEQELIIEGHSAWGHGTPTKELADKILKNGIVVNPAYSLTEIGVPLTDSTKSNNENAQGVLNSALSWPHKGHKFIVIIEIPHGLRKQQLTETVTVDGRERTRLPNRFIKGYIDVLDLLVVENPQFQLNAHATENEVPIAMPPSRENGAPPPLPSVSENSGEDIW